MILLALEALAESRAQNEAAGRQPPYITHLRPRRAMRLKAELRSIGVSFGIPFGSPPPPREPEEEWAYLGIVLGDVHVYERL